MNRFLFNIFLAVTWCMLTGSATAWNFIAGLLIGAVVVAAHSRVTGRGAYIGRMFAFVSFVVYFFYILVKANWIVAKDVLFRKSFVHEPRILRYSVEGLNSNQITVLGNAITLTPGTLSIDVSPDGKWLYLHCMYADNPAQQIRELDELASRLQKGVFA